MTQPQEDGSLYRGDGGGKKWLSPECILKVGPTGLADGLGVGTGTGREVSGMSP